MQRFRNWVNRYVHITPVAEEVECPRTSGLDECVAGSKANLMELLVDSARFRESRHYTCIVRRQNTEIGAIREQRLYQTYSKQLLRSLIRYYCEMIILVGIAKPTRGKYENRPGGEIVKRALRPGRNIEHYNRTEECYLSLSKTALSPNQYQNTLNYLLEYELPLRFYEYDPNIPFEILNIGVGKRGSFDSAILFRHFGSFNYYSSEMMGTNARPPHPVLALRSNMTQEAINNRVSYSARGVAGFNVNMRGRMDLALIIHPNPLQAIRMILDSIDFIKHGNDGLLLVIVRKEDYYDNPDLARNMQSLPRRRDICLIKKGRLNFRIENDDTAESATRYGAFSGAHGRFDYFFMYRLLPVRSRFPGFNIRNRGGATRT